jgi:hypothetical protein
MARHRDPLEPYALAVGRLCHAWAELELAVSGLFGVVAGMGIDPALATMIDCLDFRDRIKATRIGAVATSEAPPEWAEELVEALNYIDNDLRPMRNRYVHDLWRSHDDGSVLRLTAAPALYRAQARQAYSVRYGDITTESIKAVRVLIHDVKAFTRWLWDLFSFRDRMDNPSLKALLARRPRRRLLPYQPETPDPSGRHATRRVRPPES